MTASARQVNGTRNLRVWLRRSHRWLGLAAVFFVLLLSITGIALNHSDDWGLDRRYIESEWLLDAYGIEAPAVTASFADGDHGATLLGSRLYVDGRELPFEADALTGLVVLDPLVIVATGTSVVLLTVDGEVVQQLELSAELPGPIDRLGRNAEGAVIESRQVLLLSDMDVTGFAPSADVNEITWSGAAAVSQAALTELQTLYRGRGLSVERLLVEVHSGRILSRAGPLVLDIVGGGLIILSISGLVVWLRGNGQSLRRP